MPLKIAMIGACSTGFTRRLMGDLLTVPEKSVADRRHLRRARAADARTRRVNTATKLRE